MKKTVFTVGLVLLTAGLFAAGAQEDPLASYRDQVKLTGTLQFSDGYAEIAAGGKAYALMAPGFMRAAYTLKPGLKLAVEGYKVQPGPGMVKAKGEFIFVQKITIEGKEFDLTKSGGRRGCFNGPGSGYGRGQGNWNDKNGERGFGPGRGPGMMEGRPYGGMMGGRGGMPDDGPDFEDEGDLWFPGS